MVARAPSVVVIGAGFAGLAMAVALRKIGVHDFVVLEAGDRLGGTWRDNTYPGCACDVPSHLYSFSFAPNPNWSRDYSSQPEILDYLESTANRLDLRSHVVFGARVCAANWDEARALWRLETADGRTFEAPFVVAGTGPFSRPRFPAVAGLERFRGPTFHSARWDHSFDPRGKRIAAIGTGASAIQFIPELAKDATRLLVVQRSAPWVLPKADAPFREATKRAFARFPAAERLLRARIYWQLESRALGFVVDPRILSIGEWMGRRHIAAHIRDPKLARAVTPTFRMGCKRVLFSTDYYPTLTRPNVTLLPHGLIEVREDSIVTDDGRAHAVDAIVFGTGFDMTGGSLVGGPVVGRDGADLDTLWRGGAEAYLGVAVAGFPNWFLLLGPNSGLGHNSMIFMIEAQARYVAAHVARARREGLRTVEVRSAAQRQFNEGLRARLPRTVWSSGCTSWYLDERGRNVTLWPGFTVEYWLRTRRIRLADFVSDGGAS